MLLKVEGLVSGYGSLEVLHEVEVSVAEGEIVSVLGANGAGKTTTMRAVSGILPIWAGAVTFDGTDVTNWKPEKIAAAGLGHLPEGRGILASLSVRENLNIGAVVRRDGASAVRNDLDRVLGIFPALSQAIDAPAGALSGGQQQMLAIGRSLMASPRLVMIDELSFGLAPLLVDELFDVVQELRDEGMTFLLVEQHSGVLEFSDRTYILQTGRTVHEGASKDLLGSDQLVRSYLGTT